MIIILRTAAITVRASIQSRPHLITTDVSTPLFGYMVLPCITIYDGLLNLSFSRAQQIFQTLYYLIAIPFSFRLLADLLVTLSIDDRHRSSLFIYIAIFITMFAGAPPAPRPLCQSQECGRVEPLLLSGDEYTIPFILP